MASGVVRKGYEARLPARRTGSPHLWIDVASSCVVHAA